MKSLKNLWNDGIGFLNRKKYTVAFFGLLVLNYIVVGVLSGHWTIEGIAADKEYQGAFLVGVLISFLYGQLLARRVIPIIWYTGDWKDKIADMVVLFVTILPFIVWGLAYTFEYWYTQVPVMTPIFLMFVGLEGLITLMLMFKISDWTRLKNWVISLHRQLLRGCAWMATKITGILV